MAGSHRSRNWLAMGGQKGREGGEDGLRGKRWGKEATLKAMGKLGCSP